MTSHNHPQHRRAAMSSSTRPSQIYRDEEFGDITYRRVAGSHTIRVRMTPSGRLQASLPTFAPISSLKKLIEKSRDQLRTISTGTLGSAYTDGQQVGHSHTLRLIPNTGHLFRGNIAQQIIAVSHPAGITPENPDLQATIRAQVAKALRQESKAYLPRRLRYLADQGGFDYQKVRFAHQSGRWGSCSSSGTISLNIALMNLPFELIDYVLVHELAHTRQMNHSPTFWALVGQFYPDYKNARKILKTRNPYL